MNSFASNCTLDVLLNTINVQKLFNVVSIFTLGERNKNESCT